MLNAKILKIMKNFFYLFGILIWGLISSCSKSNEVPIAQHGSVVENVADCKLVSVLNAYNDSLYMSNDLLRMYDPSTNVVFVNRTRAVNKRSIFWADMCGAAAGARRGFLFGAGFGPSGAVAGAAVGGILLGAVASGLDYWIQQGESTVQNSVLSSLIVSDSIFSPLPLYNLATNLESDLATFAPLDVELNIGDDAHSIGIAHNVLLDQLLGEAYSLNDTDVPADDGNDGEPEPPSVYVGYIDELFGDEFSADMVSSEVFQQDFEEFVEQQIQISNSDDPMFPAEDLPTTVLNLCYEAASLYVDSLEDMATVVNFYYTQVENSEELTNEEKMMVRAGISVMIYSASYWADREVESGSGEEEEGVE